MRSYFFHALIVTGALILILLIKGEPPLALYDESRAAASALEYAQNGHGIVNRYDGAPDHYSLKPPLLPNLQALFIRLMGPKEMAVRLPTYLSVWLLALGLLQMGRWMGDAILGLMGAGILITSSGFMHQHTGFSADFDVLLSLFMACYAWSAFRFSQDGSVKWLLLFSLFLILAAWTKGIQAMLFLPAVCLFLLLQKADRKSLFRFAAALVGTLIACGSYYLLREQQDPGYLELVFRLEMSERMLTALDEQGHPWYFFLERLFMWRGITWVYLLPLSIIPLFISANNERRTLLRYCWLLLLTYLLVISNAQTKLIWYDAPLYPILAVLIAVTLREFLLFMNSESAFRFHPLIGSMAALLFLLNLGILLNKAHKMESRQYPSETYGLAYLLRDWHEHPELHSCELVYQDFSQHLEFYHKRMGENAPEIHWDIPENADCLLFSQHSLTDLFEAKGYRIRTLEDAVFRIQLAKPGI